MTVVSWPWTLLCNVRFLLVVGDLYQEGQETQNL